MIVIGQKYGRLTAVRLVDEARPWHGWVFKCDCGNECQKNGGYVERGNTKSCGCLMREANERKQSRATRTFTYGDETHSQAEWARLLNLSRERVRQLHNANRLESYIKEYRFMRDLKAKKLSPE